MNSLSRSERAFPGPELIRRKKFPGEKENFLFPERIGFRQRTVKRTLKLFLLEWVKTTVVVPGAMPFSSISALS